MTAPKEKREVKGVVLAGGETGRIESVLKMARSSHAVT